MSDEEKTSATQDSQPVAPRPIGIKPITIKPVAPAAPVAAPPAASVPPPPLIKPISIAPSGSGDAGAPAADSPSSTIRLKPVIPTGAPPPPVIKPPAMDTASKSKTSRISLDAALGEVASPFKPAPIGKITSNLTTEASGIARDQGKGGLPPMAGDSDVTKRKVLRVKSLGSADAAAGGAAASSAGEDAPTVLKKKPLVLKGAKGSADSAPASAQLPSFAPADGEQHVGALSAFQNRPVAKMNPVFPVLAIVASFVVAAVAILYMSQACGQDRSLTPFSSFVNISSPSLPGQVSR